MQVDLPLVDGPYLRDLLDQPRALEQTRATLEASKSLHQLAARLRRGRFKSVVLTGMGASFHALHPLQLELISHGFLAIMVETSELVHYGSRLLDPKTLVIAVSQSGQSAEIVRLLQINRGKSPVIAVTNTAVSPLARDADASVLTHAGKEFPVSCKTYVTALMALKWLGDVILERDLRRSCSELKHAAPAVQSYWKDWEAHVASLTELLKGIRHLFLVGRGSSLAAVGAGALIIKESDHFHAEGMSSAAFRHGPLEMLSADAFVIVFAGSRKTRNLNFRLLQDIRNKQGSTELVAQDASFAACAQPQAPECIRPILEILPVQAITLALAIQIGREPGRFEWATKVTTKE